MEGSPQAEEGSAVRLVTGVGEGPVETACRWLGEAAIVTMLGVIGLDIVTRSLFRFSFEISDEIGSYMLAALAFLSLPVCQAHASFHHVEFLQARLRRRGRAVSQVIFDLLALAFSGILLWQLVRFEIQSWGSGDIAPTYLGTPLWLPRLPLVLGVAALCFTLVRTLLRDLRRLGRRGAAPAS